MDKELSFNDLRIAFIEDNEHDVIAFRRSFQKSTVACRITHYERAEEALEAILADASAFDLVVTDYKLPGISGMDLCRELIQREIPLPVVLLTGAGSENLAIDALKLGAYDYIIKDQGQGYLKLLPVVLPTVVRKHSDRIERRRIEDERRKALERSKQREREVSGLLEGARAVLVNRKFIDAARAIFDACKNLVGARAGYVALLNEDKNENEVLFLDSGGLPCSIDPLLPMPIRGLRAEAFDKRRTVFDNDFSRNEWAELLPDGHVKLDNVLFSPLMIDKEVVGLLGLANKPGGFNENDARISSAFGELASVALLNSRSLDSLTASEERFRSVVDTATDAIIVADSSEKIIYWNTSAERMFGHSADEIEGQSINLIIPERFRKGHQTAIRQAVSAEKVKMAGDTATMTGLRKDGREFPVELSLATWKIGDDIFFTAIVRDITERIYAEMQLAKRTFDLGERVKELNCLYGLSHLVEKHGSSLEKVCQGIVDLIPVSWQYPAITCAAISLFGQIYQTKNFKQSQWNQTSSVPVRGESVGVVEVCYLAEKPEMDEGPFLKEERSLIDAIASRLGRIIERIDAEEILKYESNVTAALSELYEPIISPQASMEDIARTVLDKAKNLTQSQYGYVSSIDPETGDNVSHTLSQMVKGQCRVASKKGIVFPKRKDGRYGGLWGHALNSLEPFFTNSPKNHPATRGLPEGHIPIRRFLSVPVMLGEELVGQIALANKSSNYNRRDLETTGRVAEFYALAIQRNRAREALQEANEALEKRVAERTKTLRSTNIKLEKEIEERRLAEERLRQSKAMLQAVFDGISDPLILADNECRVKIINKVAADYYGVDATRDIIENYCYHVFKGRWAPCEGCKVPDAVMDGRSITFERRGFMDANRLEQVIIYPVKEKTGKTGDAIIRINDITAAKKIERQLIQSEKMASLGVLVTSIAHEINNPNNFITFNIPILRDYIQAMLTITDGYANEHPDFELCNMDYPEFRTDIYKLLDNIDHGSSRINTFVSNLREFSQENEKKPHRWVDLNKVFERATSICHNKIKKGVKSFVKDIPEHLPQVYTEPFALEQVLINLLVNAVQASDKKDSWVKLSASGGKEHVAIEVSDNGCGMDRDTRRKIFDPFFTTKSPAEGTGLGLYVCHNLIRDLGGLIGVESEPGTGSTFKVILPVTEHEPSQEACVI